jgi:transposase InsO family protein
VKAIAETLGVARSNLIERRDGARPKRGPQDRPGDPELTVDIRRLVDARPTYGYRRIAALLKRKRRADGMTPVNAKRVYRLMKKHSLLLARHTVIDDHASMTVRWRRSAPTSVGAPTRWSSPRPSPGQALLER